MEATTELRGPELARAVMNHILAHPESWNQRHWHCGTSHCFGGFCQIKGGREQTAEAGSDAQELLGIGYWDARWLFESSRTLYELYSWTKAFIEGYAEDGFDSAGFDSAGFDRAGYDSAGYDSAGYDSAGFDRAGYDSAGFDSAGFDRAGYDSAGYDSAGYDSAGFDRAGLKLELLPL